ncbi:hypothetical protein HFO65_15945 [Rhizobium laguerreae]|uniref:hypothetical protein n=1 Tax=Rhizobium laguerreae TaxID=1076926 RepID=UPI001C8FE3EB|nr:hypothetical protein [Rhizobium laguerreae]MBY3162123.1 hypothetical protein [Rhizobium laguerreae]
MSITTPDDRTTTYNPIVPTTEFAADFPVFDVADISVYVDDIQRLDFTVTADFVDGISTNAKAVFSPGITGFVAVVGTREAHRTNRFVNGAPVPVKDLNLAFDTVEAEMQEVARDMLRSHRAPYGQEGGVFDANDIEDAEANAAIATAAAAAAAGSSSAAAASAASASDDAADIAALLAGLSIIGDGSAFPQGRLTLTAGVATPVADVAGATTVYYLSAGTGRYVPHWTGVAVLPLNIVAGLSMALSSNAAHVGYHQSGRNFDLYVFDDAGTVRLGTGPSWNAGAVAGSDTARGTGAGSTELEVFQGLLVNKNAITLRWGSASGNTVAIPARQATYVGSMRTVADGQVSDTAEMRFLFNAYNQVERQLRRYDPAASWVYTSVSFRQANGNAANKLQVLLGLSGVKVRASIQHTAFNTAGSTARPCVVMFQVAGVDFPLGSTGGVFNTPALLSGIANGVAMYEGYPGLGLQELTWREAGNTDITFQSFAAGFARSGMLGSFLG